MANSASVNYNRVSFSHHFIFNLSEIKDLQPGQFVSSPIFYALGNEWVIDCYPRATRRELPRGQQLIRGQRQAFTSFFVRLHGGYKTVKTTISLSLMKRDGTTSALSHQYHLKGEEEMFRYAIQNSPFEGKVFAYGEYSNLLYKEEDIVNDGSFELICSISNTDIPHNSCSLQVPRSFDLHSQIGQLLESSETADVTFLVENRSFMCHKIVLAARSPVFKAELFGNMAEATQKQIQIEDMAPEVFEAMLHFIYTDSFPSCDSKESSQKMAEHLFVAADKYAIEGLKELCENKLCGRISLDTVAITWELALQHNSPRLKNACLNCLAEPGTLINWMLSDEYEDLVRSFLSIKAEIRDRVNTRPSFWNDKNEKRKEIAY
ncbi:BTB/POZ and MATH domain-containing protein 2-like [Carex rostrata]